jgi:DNA-binding NtrC family response regulator
VSKKIDDAWFTLDTANGVIRACSEGAAEMVGLPFDTIVGQPWQEILQCKPGKEVLEQALALGRSLALPPLLLVDRAGTERCVAGMLQAPEGAAELLLRFWPLPGAGLKVEAQPRPEDALAVLGIDHLCFPNAQGVGQSSGMIAAVRTSLGGILRSQDRVVVVGTAALALVLRGVDSEEAADMCRALLSHLHRTLPLSIATADEIRFCIGLAQGSPSRSGLATLFAANNALLLARQSGSADPIRRESENDWRLLAGWAASWAGAFNAPATQELQLAQAKEPYSEQLALRTAPPIAPLERDIDGYVVDNMEGAVDQALFLARFDIPVAIIGPAGTGKLYVARIIHDESGAAPELFLPIDCREFRSRRSANTGIGRELTRGEGKTLVFKSPHLMHHDAQIRLARQISSRILADVTPRQYLPTMKLVALFPERLEVLIHNGQLTEALASAFAGFPITVPPIRDRKQAVLRWAHKVLLQEGAARDRDMKGFTPDAERAMLNYDWPGNISEMRQCVRDALEKTEKDWLTPVDLGLFKGINPEGSDTAQDAQPFLVVAQQGSASDEVYTASTLEALDLALGEAVHALLEHGLDKPLGQWLEDDLVLAALDRYRGDVSRTASFLDTRARNISRWQPKISGREEERNSSSLWQTPRRLLREWIRELPQPEQSPLVLMQDKLMAHVSDQAAHLTAARRSAMMGVSTPTYNKRLRELAAHGHSTGHGPDNTRGDS